MIRPVDAEEKDAPDRENSKRKAAQTSDRGPEWRGRPKAGVLGVETEASRRGLPRAQYTGPEGQSLGFILQTMGRHCRV